MRSGYHATKSESTSACNGAVRFTVVYSQAATRILGSLPKDAVRRIDEAVARLEIDPRPVGAKALKGARDLLRVRVGDYRIVYRVEDATQTVFVVKIGDRRDVYSRRAR